MTAARGLALLLAVSLADGAMSADPPLLSPPYRWSVSPTIIGPPVRPGDKGLGVMDPTVVYHDGNWHLFASIRPEARRTFHIEYLRFKDWADAGKADWQPLGLTHVLHTNPQVFFFTPHKKWYLLYLTAASDRKCPAQPAVTTTTDLADPKGWTKPALLFAKEPAWVDFWGNFRLICDGTHAHLFFTDRRAGADLWRVSTKLSDFPGGWGEPQPVKAVVPGLVLRVYKVKGRNQYLMLTDGEAKGRRYLEAHTAGRLDGEWKALGDAKGKPFAGLDTLAGDGLWTDTVFTGDLLRAGADETMEVDPEKVRLVFAGVSAADRKDKDQKDKNGKDKDRKDKDAKVKDGKIKEKPFTDFPWRLGLLELAPRK